MMGLSAITSEPEANSAQPADALFTAVYARLKAMASQQLARVDGATLDTTALVHEVYVKICAGHELTFSNPVQFFDYAAQAMRHILVDRARQRLRFKRGGDVARVDLDAAADVAETTAEYAIELDQALLQLERDDPRAARLVSLHYFAGLSLPQIATLLEVAPRTLSRDWRFARAFLHDLLA